ncbi:hypothetical protein [Nocardia nepalensis]|uniref:hypothetical protein n=1 Tax=Nocardia nepalensis TaxID=3375448 RepID=UPI003B66B51D
MYDRYHKKYMIFAQFSASRRRKALEFAVFFLKTSSNALTSGYESHDRVGIVTILVVTDSERRMAMTVSETKRSAELVELALVTAARAAGGEHTTVGIWLVWLHRRQVMSWEWITRLNIAIPAYIPVGAEQVVVVAVAPTRVAGAVIGRVDVICEQAEAAGLVAEAVYVSASLEGALWTCLRTSGCGGIVPALTGVDRSSARPRRFTRFLGAGSLRRTAIIAMTPIVGIFCAMTGHADPGGQAGVIATPGSGQAGVTTRPPVSVNPTPHKDSTVTVYLPQPSSPVPDWDDAPDQEPANGFDDSTLCLGAETIPRPDWLPRELAGPEHAWNEYLAHQATIELDRAGALIGAGADYLNRAGLLDVAASGAALTALSDLGAVVGPSDGEAPMPSVTELTEIAASSLPQWEIPTSTVVPPVDIFASEQIPEAIQGRRSLLAPAMD